MFFLLGEGLAFNLKKGSICGMKAKHKETKYVCTIIFKYMCGLYCTFDHYFRVYSFYLYKKKSWL